MISVNDTGINISNGKGAMITMTGPTVDINNGALVTVIVTDAGTDPARRARPCSARTAGRPCRPRRARACWFGHAGRDDRGTVRRGRLRLRAAGGNGPCVTGQWIVGAVARAVAGAAARHPDRRSICAPTGTPLLPVAAQTARHSRRRSRAMSISVDFPSTSTAAAARRTRTTTHVRQLVEQVLFTSPGERVNLPDFGSGLLQLLFAPNSVGARRRHAVHRAGRAAEVAQSIHHGAVRRRGGERRAAERHGFVLAAEQRRHAGADVREQGDPVIYRCCDEKRRAAVARNPTLNGIDYLEVLLRRCPLAPAAADHPDGALPEARARRARTPDRHHHGGRRATASTSVKVVTWATPARRRRRPMTGRPANGLASTTLHRRRPPKCSRRRRRPAPPTVRCSTVDVDRAGEFSTYVVRIVADPVPPQPPTGFDPLLSEVEFSFKVECPAPSTASPQPPGAAESAGAAR